MSDKLLFIERPLGTLTDLRIRLFQEHLECQEFGRGIHHVFKTLVNERRQLVSLFWNTILRILNIREHGFYLGLHLLGIEISDYHNSLKIRTIPLVVEVQYFFSFKVIDNIEGAYDISLRESGPLIKDSLLKLKNSGLGTCSGTPFFSDDTTFVIQFLLLARNVS